MATHSFIAKIIITIGLVISLGLAVWGGLDQQGSKYTDAGLKRAMIAFGVARGINGVISVAQGTEISLQPAGVGVNLAPGQILDPVNDLIERFSVVMLFSASSLGVQKLFLTVSSWPWLTALLAILVAVFLINLWREKKFLSKGIQKVLIVFLLIRFTVPAFALANEAFYQLFLSQSYKTSLSKLEATSEKIDALNQEVVAKTNDSFLGRAKEIFQSASNSINLKQKFAHYKEIATHTSDHVVTMIVIFIVQTVLLPLGFLWLVMGLARRKRLL